MLPWSVMPTAGCPSATAGADHVADAGRTVEHRELGVQVEVGERVPSAPFPAVHTLSTLPHRAGLRR